MSQLKVVIAYNPHSGSFNTAQLDKLGAAFAGAGYDPVFADSHGEEVVQLMAISDHLCVVGGDGSLRDIISRLDGRKNLPPVSVYPAGTINLVAREARYPADIEKFVKRAVTSGGARNHFYGSINGDPVLACASIGPDSVAVASLSENLKRRIGRFAYAAAFLKLLPNWPRCHMTVLANGNSYHCEAAFILKGRFFAGPWQISEAADVTIPEFQLLLMPKARRRDYLRLIMSVTISPALASSKWLRISAKSAEITGDMDMPVQVDGDPMSMLPVKAEIAPYPVKFA